jgi:transposase-like protein
MSGRKKLTTDESLALVLAGLKGDIPIADLCRQYGVSQATYYKLRDRFLQGGKSSLETTPSRQRVKKLEKRIEDLEAALGRKQLEVELLKKATGLLRDN